VLTAGVVFVLLILGFLISAFIIQQHRHNFTLIFVCEIQIFILVFAPFFGKSSVEKKNMRSFSRRLKFFTYSFNKILLLQTTITLLKNQLENNLH